MSKAKCQRIKTCTLYKVPTSISTFYEDIIMKINHVHQLKLCDIPIATYSVSIPNNVKHRLLV